MSPRSLRTLRHSDGSDSQWPLDWDQSKRLTRLWIKIDALKQFESSEQKRAISQTRKQFISATVPLRRVWLLLKNLKQLSRSDSKTFIDFTGTGLDVGGVEDVLAEAHKVFDIKTLGHLMQGASQLEEVGKRSGTVDVIASTSRNGETSAQKFWQEVLAAFACGTLS